MDIDKYIKDKFYQITTKKINNKELSLIKNYLRDYTSILQENFLIRIYDISRKVINNKDIYNNYKLTLIKLLELHKFINKRNDLSIKEFELINTFLNQY